MKLMPSLNTIPAVKNICTEGEWRGGGGGGEGEGEGARRKVIKNKLGSLSFVQLSVPFAGPCGLG